MILLKRKNVNWTHCPKLYTMCLLNYLDDWFDYGDLVKANGKM